jgi:hypothetical protein
MATNVAMKRSSMKEISVASGSMGTLHLKAG